MKKYIFLLASSCLIITSFFLRWATSTGFRGSLASIVLPPLVSLLSPGCIYGVVFSGVFLNVFGFLTIPTFGLPTAGMILYWHISFAHTIDIFMKWSVQVGIPLICIMLFWMHPTGFLAWPYALYWCMPIFMICIEKHLKGLFYIFYKALCATLIAHSIGSVIWLYTMPTTSDYWYELIPIVIVERLFFAIAIFSMHVLFTTVGYNRKYAFISSHILK